MEPLPHEQFLRELHALCEKHGVVLEATEDDGIVVCPKGGGYADIGGIAFVTFSRNDEMICSAAARNFDTLGFSYVEPDLNRKLVLLRRL